MAGCNYFREVKKLYSVIVLLPALKHSNLQRKNILLGTTTWITVFSYELLFHQHFCTSVGNCSSMLFPHLYTDTVRPSKHLLVQSKQ